MMRPQVFRALIFLALLVMVGGVPMIMANQSDDGQGRQLQQLMAVTIMMDAAMVDNTFTFIPTRGDPWNDPGTVMPRDLDKGVLANAATKVDGSIQGTRQNADRCCLMYWNQRPNAEIWRQAGMRANVPMAAVCIIDRNRDGGRAPIMAINAWNRAREDIHSSAVASIIIGLDDEPDGGRALNT